MPEYLSPGVYVEEVDSGSKPIEGVGTRTAAFVGHAAGGEFNKPELITNWTQYCEKFGDKFGSPWLASTYLSHAVYGFFNNGGTRCYVVRIPRAVDIPSNGTGETPAQAAIGQLGPFRVQASLAGPTGNDVYVEVQKIGEEPLTEHFRLVIKSGDKEETIEQVGSGRNTQPLNAGNVQTAVKAHSKLIEVVEVSQDAVQATSVQLAGGIAAMVKTSRVAELKAEDFEGDVAKRTGVGGYTAIDDVTMICAPDLMAGLYYRELLQPKVRKVRRDGKEVEIGTCPRCKSEIGLLPVMKCPVPACDAQGDEKVNYDLLEARKTKIKDWQGKMLTHSELMHDRVAILDAPPGMNPQEITQYRMVDGNFDSKFGALYYPWIQVMDPSTKAPTMVPPCGHMAGIWARNDGERGVHKAPANEVVRGAIDLEYNISKGEQDGLNPIGINCIRDFPGRGRRVWGARTLSSDPAWRYLNIRRFFNYLEKSIERGTQWVVFEPNDYDLWQRVRRNIGAFLRLHWQEGMLFGATADDAYFVKCDEETNPQESVELGRLVCEIGVRPVYPAEFVIFRIGQWSGGSNAEE